MIRRPFLTAAVDRRDLRGCARQRPLLREMHHVRVTLVTGQVMTFTVEVAARHAVDRGRSSRRLPAPVADDRGPRAGRRCRRRSPTPQLPLPTATPTLPRCRSRRPRLTTPARRARPATPSTPVTPGGGSDGGQTPDPAAPDKGKTKRPGANTETLNAQGEGQGARGAQPCRRRQPRPQHRRHPDARQPDLLARRPPAPPRSACRTSSSTSSGSRRSCSRSTRPPASSTASAGRSWPRSTRSRPTTAAT